MEKDFGDHEIDEDDTMDFAEFKFGQIPEKPLQLKGEEFEFSGLEPYIYISHACTENRVEAWDSFNVTLETSMYLSATFDVIIDLDTKKSTVIKNI